MGLVRSSGYRSLTVAALYDVSRGAEDKTQALVVRWQFGAIYYEHVRLHFLRFQL
jgi:hypothetical protein